MEHLLINTVILLFGSVTAIVLCRLVGLSPIIGYIAAGLILGPHAVGLISESQNIIFLAELGVVFLMFMVGLEFSLPAMIAARHNVFLGGGLQMLLCMVFPLVVSLLLGFSVIEAFLLSGALAMSSTALVLKQLSEQKELNTIFGRSVLGILLFQDLASLPFLVVITALGLKGDVPLLDVLYGITRAVLLFGILYVTGRFLLTRFVGWVVSTKSSDLRILTILSIIFGAAFTVHAAGASLPIGAFLAGMIISETNFKHEIEEDIRPFREVLLGLFFVTVGMTLNPLIISNQIVPILIMTAFLLIGKVFIITLLLRLIGRSSFDSLSSALCLSQGGEFGLLIATLASGQAVLPDYLAQGLTSAIVLSMVLASQIISHKTKLAVLLLRVIGRVPG